MGKPSYRIDRINGRIKEILGDLILTSIKDPRVGMVTITAVKVSADLSYAKIYYSVMGDESARADTRSGLESAKNFMRRTVADELGMRNAPELRFVYDDTLDRALAIDDKLREVGLGDDSPAEAEEDETNGEDGR